MTRPQTLKAHAALMDRMATSLDLDLEAAMMRGRLQVDTLGDAVLRCTGCTRAADCTRWMDDLPTGRTERAPDYCRNGNLFAGLRAGKRF